ncbi:hypothetical protein M9H77_19252 [Catharanthus roseus]|uniref:Uncharacterized protein n=1 Tax=Catharanthus roseus TaxID=4058 RepID=A0ACC0B9U8_CATRO|nr:hypothetical protein M9H77_19252 [Catharanthus roseus]
MVKDLWLRVLKLVHLRSLAPLPPMGFTAAVEVATWTEIADQTFIQKKAATGPATTSYKRPRQGPWKLGDSKRRRGKQRTENRGQQTLTPRGVYGVLQDHSTRSAFRWTLHRALRWDGSFVESQEGLEIKVSLRPDLNALWRSKPLKL